MAEKNLLGKNTLLDLMSRTDGAGNLLPIGEQLVEDNQWLQDAVWVESNETSTHLYALRVYEPVGSKRRINRGVPATASKVEQRRAEMMMTEDVSLIDEKLLKIQNNPTKYRSDEDLGHMGGLGKQMAKYFLYGNRGVDADEIDGMFTKMAAINESTFPRVYDGGGTGSSLTSLLGIQWGLGKVYLIYPKGSKTFGIDMEDKGLVRVTDDSGSYYAWETRFYFDFGIVIEDERCVFRAANIPTAVGTTSTILEHKMIHAMNKMRNRGSGAVMYANSDLMTQFDLLAKDNTAVDWQVADYAGVDITTFKRRPIKLMDQILVTESELV